MAAETPDTEVPQTTDKFELDGVMYESPNFLDLSIDEWRMVEQECDVVLADFSELDDPDQEAKRTRRLASPNVERAFIMVALVRARPDDDLDEIRKAAGSVKLVPYLLDRVIADEENPTSASALERSSSRSSDDSIASSSKPSPRSSETPETPLVPTGTTA